MPPTGSRSAKHAPTSSPGPAMIAATARNSTGSVSQIGGPVVAREEKKITSVLCFSTLTGYAETNPISPSNATGEYNGASRVPRLARSRPRPTPRNDPSRTKFEK